MRFLDELRFVRNGNFDRNITSCCMLHTHWPTESECSRIGNDISHSTKNECSSFGSIPRARPVCIYSCPLCHWHHGFNPTSWASCLRRMDVGGDKHFQPMSRSTRNHLLISHPSNEQVPILIVFLFVRCDNILFPPSFPSSFVYTFFDLKDEICLRFIGLCPRGQRCYPVRTRPMLLRPNCLWWCQWSCWPAQ